MSEKDGKKRERDEERGRESEREKESANECYDRREKERGEIVCACTVRGSSTVKRSENECGQRGEQLAREAGEGGGKKRRGILSPSKCR